MNARAMTRWLRRHTRCARRCVRACIIDARVMHGDVQRVHRRRATGREVITTMHGGYTRSCGGYTAHVRGCIDDVRGDHDHAQRIHGVV